MKTAARNVLLAALGLTLGACSSASNDADTAFATADAEDLGYLARGAHIVETGVDGKARYRVTAATIAQPANNRPIELTTVAMELVDARGARWNLSADAGQMPAEARRIDLAGDVQIRGEAGKVREPIEIRTASLRYDIDTERAVSDADVTIQLTGKRLEARGLDANLKDRQLQLKSKVHGRFNP